MLTKKKQAQLPPSPPLPLKKREGTLLFLLSLKLLIKVSCSPTLKLTKISTVMSNPVKTEG